MCYQVDPLVYWYSLVSIRYFAITRTTNHDVTKVNCCISAEVRPEFFRNYFQYFFYFAVPRNTTKFRVQKSTKVHVYVTCTLYIHVHVHLHVHAACPCTKCMYRECYGGPAASLQYTESLVQWVNRLPPAQWGGNSCPGDAPTLTGNRDLLLAMSCYSAVIPFNKIILYKYAQ